MASDSPSEVWRTVARRAALLDALSEGPMEKRALASAVAVSRSTVDRAVDELAALNLVAAEAGRVRLTAAGELAVDRYREALAGLDELLTVAPYLDALDERLRPPASFFGATEVVTVDDGAHVPTQHLIDAFVDADRCRLVRGPVRPALPTEVRDAVLDGRLALDAVLCGDAVEFLRSYHGTDFRRALDLPDVSITRIDVDLRSGLYLLDDGPTTRVALSIHDDPGDEVRATLSTTSPEAVAWAEATFRDVRERATTVTPE